jgi:polysaccharide export outer membrane protein
MQGKNSPIQAIYCQTISFSGYSGGIFMNNKKLIVFLLFTFHTMWAIEPIFAEDKESLDSNKKNLAVQTDPAYTIGAGDILEITTWKEADLTKKEIRVRTDGKITFPLLNDIKAAGLTTIELKKEIETGLKKFIDNPYVIVGVKEPVSKKFYILGEVKKTGEYPIVKNLTILQAFALAGGFTEWASKKEIILLRHEGGKEKIIRVNYKDITKGKDFSQNLKLKADDTIIVP